MNEQEAVKEMERKKPKAGTKCDMTRTEERRKSRKKRGLSKTTVNDWETYHFLNAGWVVWYGTGIQAIIDVPEGCRPDSGCLTVWLQPITSETSSQGRNINRNLTVQKRFITTKKTLPMNKTRREMGQTAGVPEFIALQIRWRNDYAQTKWRTITEVFISGNQAAVLKRP